MIDILIKSLFEEAFFMIFIFLFISNF